MHPNHDDFVPDACNTPGFGAVEKVSMQEVLFTERIQSFEQGCTSVPAGYCRFLRIATADLFRTIVNVEGEAVSELQDALENPFEQKQPALRQYARTLRVLRRALEASVELEISSTG